MKKGFCALVCAICVGSGCVTLPWQPPPSEPPPSPQVTTRASSPRPAVTPEQINGSNAREMAGALRDELERDAQNGALSPH
jgi:hypothetical protein